MTAPEPQPRAEPLVIVGRVLAGVLTAAAGFVFVVLAVRVIQSRFGLASGDPHGYGLLIGSLIGVIAAHIVAIALPLVFARRRRHRMYAVTIPAFLVVLVLAIVAVVTN